MSRIAILGTGPLPCYDNPDRMSALGIGTWQHTRALLDAGHEVLTITYEFGSQSLPRDPTYARPLHTWGRLEHRAFPEPDLHNRKHLIKATRSLLKHFKPDGLVSQHTPIASLVSTELDLNVPTWFDLQGYLPGEIQAELPYKDFAPLHLLMLNLYRTILLTGDRFSANSSRQRLATIGELGLMGRLNADTLGSDMVATIPSGHDPTLPFNAEPGFLRGRLCPEDAFIVLWSGGMNTWVDVPTLIATLRKCLEDMPRFHFVLTGGAIKGHHEQGFQDLQTSLEGTPDAERVHLLGWIEYNQLLRCYRDADLGLLIDLPIFESEMGSRTRFLDWMWAGLPIATTTHAELAERLTSAECAIALPAGDPSGITQILQNWSARPEALERIARRAGQYDREHYTYAQVAEPVVRWAEKPCFAEDRPHGRLRENVLNSHLQRVQRLARMEIDVHLGKSPRRLRKIDKLLG